MSQSMRHRVFIKIQFISIISFHSISENHNKHEVPDPLIARSNADAECEAQTPPTPAKESGGKFPSQNFFIAKVHFNKFVRTKMRPKGGFLKKMS